MTDTYIIQEEVVVNVPQHRAFEVFTSGFDTWWPRTHHIGKCDMKEAVLEQKLGGRWYEKGVDGSECEWGKVIAWEPYSRFAVTWQLTHDFKYDPNFVTEVEVTFKALGVNKTRVVLTHKNLDRYGDMTESVRNNIGNAEGGWGGLLRVFAATAERASVSLAAEE